jgi:hypothetical protein
MPELSGDRATPRDRTRQLRRRLNLLWLRVDGLASMAKAGRLFVRTSSASGALPDGIPDLIRCPKGPFTV